LIAEFVQHVAVDGGEVDALAYLRSRDMDHMTLCRGPAAGPAIVSVVDFTRVGLAGVMRAPCRAGGPRAVAVLGLAGSIGR